MKIRMAVRRRCLINGGVVGAAIVFVDTGVLRIV